MNENVVFWRVFAVRTLISFIVVILFFLSCILRISVIASSDYSEILEKQNTLRLKIKELRGTIFDCNLVPLTNNNKKIIAAVSPTPRAVTAISAVLEGDALENALERLRDGKPILCEVPKKIECDGIVCTEIYETDPNSTTAIHILGYTDAENSGVSGLEKAYNSTLNRYGEAYISYECDGKGEPLIGIAPLINNSSSIIANGIVSTIDANIQNIAEAAIDGLQKGAVVIAEAESGKIRAIASRPNFSISNLKVKLNDKDSPLLNRAINAYNVGSVFKPCVAASALKNGNSQFFYNCTGSCKIIDRSFKCHELNGHGFLNLKQGIANSCNTYFYNLGINLGGAKILNTALSLQFGEKIRLCEGIETAPGKLPRADTLKNIAHLANFSIGQGELLLSPVSMLTLYSAIATNGTYYLPTVVEGILENGKIKSYATEKPTRAMSEETADILKECLFSVIEEGTGTDAKPKTVTAAGKTATAQTGKFVNGIEINEGWFCGFFPYENPKYVVIVFSEDTSRQTKTCSQIFAEIADNITALTLKN